MNELCILILDDEERLRDEMGEFLKKRNYKVLLSGHPDDFFVLLKNHLVDIAIVDIRLPKMSGLEVLKQVRILSPETEVIMISGHGDMNSVIEAMRHGAFDYFQKPFRAHDVQLAIERTQKFIALNQRLKERENTIRILTDRLRQNVGAPMIGESSAMKEVMSLMERVALSDQTSVLITGESGTGKELVAHGIHLLSQRQQQIFYSVNCSAITDSLFESEFFGHRKGSFTGALDDRPGCFEIATKGTLFLDEIGDMPIGQQAKLLRAIEEKKVRPVGAKNSIDVDVRIIAASNQHLEQMIEERKFRYDLYHRLSSFVIHLPPLRERNEDIPLLINHFATVFAQRMNRKDIRVSDEAVRMLAQYPFPGNIRELRNAVERAMILANGNILLPKHFPLAQNHYANSATEPQMQDSVLNTKEKDIILRTLKSNHFNKSKTAVQLNISWQSLHRKMKKYGIKKPDSPDSFS
ncbi:MAG: sigma-54-dependent Fis family transcriptional regulator [Bacteroidales bacterium]|nr:sigma-54-dependent Fis family transcriptional regulator [Bacteroidales bacterium]